ncbi:MAG: PIN domain-containing protein [Thermodesulfobacteriota bacterium]|nr:PIN domain-containing protein [Thermodesulfobacteriota bacterium]
MKVIVDTSVWSLFLRRARKQESPYVSELRELIRELRAQMIGPVRQELLSGIRSKTQFQNLKEHLAAFPDLALTTADYERAAEFFNISRRKGIQGSNTDFLICALSVRYNMPILTTNEDFTLFQKNIPIKLHRPRKENFKQEEC